MNTTELKKGDIFIWKSLMRGNIEVHIFHSDAGYGIKTMTEYNEKDGSSVLVNYSGVIGKIGDIVCLKRKPTICNSTPIVYRTIKKIDADKLTIICDDAIEYKIKNIIP